MGCSATVGTTVSAGVLQLLGTLCIAFVVAIVLSCDAMVDTGSQLTTCAGYAVGQPCVTDDNIAICNSLLADGCAYLVVKESCPLQFACQQNQQTGRRQQQAYEDCGPAGVCGEHAHCVGACDDDICSSVRCQCEPGFEPYVENYVTTCEPGSTGRVPAPAPAATDIQGSYAVRSSTQSSSGHVNLCSAAGPDWITTKVLGVLGGVLLVSATPLISCQAAGCAGCGERRQRPGGQVAFRAWQLYALASFGVIICGILGIGFSMQISMVVPVVVTCAFDTTFIVMCWARVRDPQSCSNVEAASQVVPLVVVESAVNASNEKSPAIVPA